MTKPPMYTNLQVGTYGASRFEVQGDVLIHGRRSSRRTVSIAVFATLAQAQNFVRQLGA